MLLLIWIVGAGAYMYVNPTITHRTTFYLVPDSGSALHESEQYNAFLNEYLTNSELLEFNAPRSVSFRVQGSRFATVVVAYLEHPEDAGFADSVTQQAARKFESQVLHQSHVLVYHSGARYDRLYLRHVGLSSLGIVMSLLLIYILYYVFSDVLYDFKKFKLSGINVLSIISLSNRFEDILTGETINTRVAEQYRFLYIKLIRQLHIRKGKCTLVTSAISGEGKSTIALNLALTVAISSNRVLLLEGDMRKPKISERLNISNEGGVSGYLAGLVGLDEVIKESGVHPNLFVANCGPVPPSPTELVLLPRMKHLIEQLSELFDLVIIDSPPASLCAEAAHYAALSDYVLYVARMEHSHYEHTVEEYRSMELFNANIGLVVNGVREVQQSVHGYRYDSNY